MAIEVLIILTGAWFPSFFSLDKEEWHGLERLWGGDFPCLEVFFNELFAGLMFNGIEQVSLGPLEYKQSLSLMAWSYGQEGGNLVGFFFWKTHPCIPWRLSVGWPSLWLLLEQWLLILMFIWWWILGHNCLCWKAWHVVLASKSWRCCIAHLQYELLCHVAYITGGIAAPILQVVLQLFTYNELGLSLPYHLSSWSPGWWPEAREVPKWLRPFHNGGWRGHNTLDRKSVV